MSWWETALYDTCSLITLDKLYQERPSLSQFFPLAHRKDYLLGMPNPTWRDLKRYRFPD